MSKSLFTHLRKRGIHVYLWVLNSEEEYKRAFELGADGVMTDFPSKLSEFLARHPQYDRDNYVEWKVSSRPNFASGLALKILLYADDSL